MLKLHNNWAENLKTKLSGYTAKDRGQCGLGDSAAVRIREIDKMIAAGEAVYMEDGK